MRTALRLALSAAMGLLASAAASPASAQEGPPDVLVHLDGGKTVTRQGGRVETHDHDQVVYSTGGKKQTVPGADVVEIRWGDADPEYQKGLAALDTRDGESARKSFESTLKAVGVVASLRPWVAEYGNLGLGEAYLLLGAKDAAAAGKAAEAFAKAREANPKSLRLDRILMGTAEAELLRDKPDAALKAADDLVAAGKTARRPEWELQGLLLRARVHERRSNWAGAATAYDEVSRFAETSAPTLKDEAVRQRVQRAGVSAGAQKGWALLAKAEASKAAGEFEEARRHFDAMAAKYPRESAVLAAASNAAGVAKLAAGDARGALRLFQTTEVRYFDVPEEVARSLYYQAEAHQRLGDEKSRGDRIRDLKEYYPASEWARRAK